MNFEVLRARREQSLAAMRAMVEDYAQRDDDFSDEDQKRFDELEASAMSDTEAMDRISARVAAIDNLRTATESDGQFNINTRTSDDPYDLGSLRYDTSAQDLRGRAHTAIESDAFLPDSAKEAAVRILRSVDRKGEVAQLVLATGNPHYRSAFPKLATGQQWALTEDERRAVARAQNMSNGAGGFAVPFTLDPTIIWTDAGVINPMRQLATIKTITTEDWSGVTSAGATAHWRGEAEEVDDDGITLAQPNIPVHRFDMFIPYSIEIDMDWAAMESELREAMNMARDNLEAAAHFNGTGTGQPTGLITALAGTASQVAPAVAETFAIGDVYNLRRVLPPRHRQTREQPVWLANLGTYDAIRGFDTGGGGGFWTDMNNGTPDRLLGIRTYETSLMADARDINAAVTANNRILLVGDVKKYYIIDRVGMRVENIPHLFGTGNNRPTGQRGIFAMGRSGAEPVDINAFRLLNVATTA